MRIKFTFNNEDKIHLNKKWIKVLLLIFGFLFAVISFVQIFCIRFKPHDYEDIVSILGNKYVQQLLISVLCFVSYYLIKNSKPVNSNEVS